MSASRLKELDKRTLVESALRAWNRGDLDAFAMHVSEDVAWLEVSGRPEGDSIEGQIVRIEAYRDPDQAAQRAGVGA
jgi:hypothetical protein